MAPPLQEASQHGDQESIRREPVVDKQIAEQWLDEILKPILMKYTPKNAFNADETAVLFFFFFGGQCLIRRLLFEKTNAKGKKRSKERITVLVCANAD